MNDKMQQWLAARIEQAAPHHGHGIPMFQALLQACQTLKRGSGDLFGMSVPSGFEFPADAYPRACSQLQAWVLELPQHLSEEQCHGVYFRIRSLGLNVTTPEPKGRTPAPQTEPDPIEPALVEAAQRRLDQLEPLWSEPEWSGLLDAWNALADPSRSGLASSRAVTSGPLQAEDLARVERDLGRPVPDELVRAGQNAANISVAWSLPGHAKIPRELADLHGGMDDPVWNLLELADIAGGAAETGFHHPDDGPNPWTESLAFAGGGEGNYLAWNAGTVIFLHHESDPGLGHQRQVAPDFRQFIERWTALACPDICEPSILEAFLGDDGLDPACELALLWAECRSTLVQGRSKPDWLSQAFEDDE